MNAVNRIAERYQMPVIYSTHPRSRKFIEQRGFAFHPAGAEHETFWLFGLQQAADERLLCAFRQRHLVGGIGHAGLCGGVGAHFYGTS